MLSNLRLDTNMNAYQKATILLTFAGLPLVLLFMDGMNYPGIGFVALTATTAACGLVYALRTSRGTRADSPSPPRSAGAWVNSNGHGD